MLSHGAVPYSEVQLPEFISGETEIKAVIINTVGARAEVDFTVKVSSYYIIIITIIIIIIIIISYNYS